MGGAPQRPGRCLIPFFPHFRITSYNNMSNTASAPVSSASPAPAAPSPTPKLIRPSRKAVFTMAGVAVVGIALVLWACLNPRGRLALLGDIASED